MLFPPSYTIPKALSPAGTRLQPGDRYRSLFLQCFVALLLSLASHWPLQAQSSLPAVSQDASAAAVFDQALETIQNRFYDPDRLDMEFQQHANRLRKNLSDHPDQLADSINQLLKRLNASHTYYLTASDTEYFRIASVFQKLPHIAKLFPDGKPLYPSIGILPVRLEGRWYVQDILPKTAAASSGLKIGDHLVSVNDQAFHPIDALLPRKDQTVSLQVLRKGQTLTFELPVQMADPQQEFLQALNDSFQVVEIDGQKVGYAHFYSYAGKEYQDALLEATRWGILSEADSLVLDMRYGMGGADLAYLNMFQSNLPSMTMIQRDGTSRSLNGQWTKPVVYVIDGTARSGKETIAYGAKKLGLAKLVGTPTAGAVVAGSPFVMENGDILYLAVADVLVDGQHLEGNPVTPDVLVPWDITTCDGMDLQKQAAMKLASELAKKLTPEMRDKSETDSADR